MQKIADSPVCLKTQRHKGESFWEMWLGLVVREGGDLSNRSGVYPLFGEGEMKSLQGSVTLVIYLNQYLSDMFGQSMAV